ncbi:MAG: hypothetical protein GY745_03650 [Actinomycetia bacterium]|nr:hypothetical protein [Actinomycetes bacterium]
MNRPSGPVDHPPAQGPVDGPWSSAAAGAEPAPSPSVRHRLIGWLEDSERAGPVARSRQRRIQKRRRSEKSRRYAMVYDTAGPKVRLGFLWFIWQFEAIYLGRWAVALTFAAVAGMAGWQAAKTWVDRGAADDRWLVAGLVGVCPLAAWAGTGLLGLTILLVATVALMLAAVRGHTAVGTLVKVGEILRVVLVPAVGAGAVVLVYKIDIGAIVALSLLVAAYEMGDYLVGSGSPNVVEGPIAGIAAVAVVGFALSLPFVQPPPFEGTDIQLFAALVALMCPIGQVLASWVLPRSAAPAPALRRLDSWLVAAPVWVVILWSYTP